MIRRFATIAALVLSTGATAMAQPLITPATGFTATGGFRLRGGDQGGAAQQELYYGANWNFTPPSPQTANGAFTFDEALAFTFAFDGVNTLTFSWGGFNGGATYSTVFSSTPSFNALQLTANAGERTTVSLTDMNYGIADLVSTGSSFQSAAYGNLRNDAAWKIEGTLAMNGLRTAGERPQVQFQVGNATFATVPEPASLALLATGMAGMLAAARRRRA